MNKSIDMTKFERIGNNLSLDFINTDLSEGEAKTDLLSKTADLAIWAAAMDLVGADEAKKMLGNWGAMCECPVLLANAREFRRKLRELFAKATTGATPEALPIEFINEYLREKNNGLTEVVKTESGFEKKFRINFREPAQILAVVAESAADLLCYGNLEYLRKCECPKCPLFFYDTTKNHKRRWCSMAACGNRAKAMAFYQRKKAIAGKIG
jgi:predicted RNA-binding Zn ribbon-like protein